MHKYYPGIHFFNAHVIQEKPPLYIELSKIYRQQNDDFIAVLNNLRNNKMSEKDVAVTSFKLAESLISTLPTQQCGKENLRAAVNAKLNYRTSTNKYEG